MGVPQPWEKSKKNLNYVREAGVRQFISTYKRVKDLKGDELLWGDEVEYGIFVLDEENKKIRLSLRAKEVCCMYLICFIPLFLHLLWQINSYMFSCQLILWTYLDYGQPQQK